MKEIIKKSRRKMKIPVTKILEKVEEQWKIVKKIKQNGRNWKKKRREKRKTQLDESNNKQANENKDPN